MRTTHLCASSTGVLGAAAGVVRVLRKGSLATTVLGTVALTTIAVAQAPPGQSNSVAYVYRNDVGYICTQNVGPAPTTNAACNGSEFLNGVGAASAISDNGMRKASSGAALVITGPAQPQATGIPTQASSLTVTGTPGTGDMLVFHFLTNQTLEGTGATTQQSSALWDLFLGNTNTADQAYATQTILGNGTTLPLNLLNATQTSGGFNLMLPFAAGNTFSFDFVPRSLVVIGNDRAGTALSASISATLQGIDAVTPSGTFISAATFDPTTGLGAINLQGTVSTVPEPSTLALVATGLVGIVPAMRRRKK